eukprot:365596-Chlamydomonas_euryale.AAC.32
MHAAGHERATAVSSQTACQVGRSDKTPPSSMPGSTSAHACQAALLRAHACFPELTDARGECPHFYAACSVPLAPTLTRTRARTLPLCPHAVT